MTGHHHQQYLSQAWVPTWYFHQWAFLGSNPKGFGKLRCGISDLFSAAIHQLIWWDMVPNGFALPPPTMVAAIPAAQQHLQHAVQSKSLREQCTC